MEENKIENQNNNYETISISKIEKKSLMKKYQSFRYSRNTDDKKKYTLIDKIKLLVTLSSPQ